MNCGLCIIINCGRFKGSTFRVSVKGECTVCFVCHVCLTTTTIIIIITIIITTTDKQFQVDKEIKTPKNRNGHIFSIHTLAHSFTGRDMAWNDGLAWRFCLLFVTVSLSGPPCYRNLCITLGIPFLRFSVYTVHIKRMYYLVKHF